MVTQTVVLVLINTNSTHTSPHYMIIAVIVFVKSSASMNDRIAMISLKTSITWYCMPRRTTSVRPARVTLCAPESRRVRSSTRKQVTIFLFDESYDTAIFPDAHDTMYAYSLFSSYFVMRVSLKLRMCSICSGVAFRSGVRCIDFWNLKYVSVSRVEHTIDVLIFMIIVCGMSVTDT